MKSVKKSTDFGLMTLYLFVVVCVLLAAWVFWKGGELIPVMGSFY